MSEAELSCSAAPASPSTDPLTGLANRQLLLDRLGYALLRQQRRGGAVAVMFLDLDDFKLVNGSLGHTVGDQVLRTVLRPALRGALRGEDTIARPSSPGDIVACLGGDEFVILLEGLRDAANAAEVADRILVALREPVVVDEHQLDLDASVGIALTWGEYQHEPIDLLRDADTAMYAAKERGKGSCRFFEDEMHQRVVARTDVSRQLRSAIDDGQLRRTTSRPAPRSNGSGRSASRSPSTTGDGTLRAQPSAELSRRPAEDRSLVHRAPAQRR